MFPRGIRNNNPGNIEHGDNWDGLAEEQPDPRFCSFVSPDYGIRAMCRIWFSYSARMELTVENVVSTWAPPHENPTEHYIANIRKWAQRDVIDLTDAESLAMFARAFARQENGLAHWPMAVYLSGATLAIRK